MHVDDLHDLLDASPDAEERRDLDARMDSCCLDCGWEPDDCLCHLPTRWHIDEEQASQL